MQIKYFFQNIKLSGELKDFLEEKIQKLSRFSEKIWEARVDLSYHPTRVKGHQLTYVKGEKIRLEINLRMPNKILRGVARAKDLSQAVDMVEKKLRKQLEAYREFGKIKRRRTAKMIRSGKETELIQ